MFKAVLDTNVLVSLFIFPERAIARIADFWRERKFTLILSEEILQELEKVLHYPKISKRYVKNKETVKDYLNGLRVFAEICRPRRKILAVKDDPSDNKFLETAVSVGADFIISGDKHLLKLKEFEGIKIMTVADFVDFISRQ
jgi:putative PIN family toxin of toxin-antitoxin system